MKLLVVVWLQERSRSRNARLEGILGCSELSKCHLGIFYLLTDILDILTCCTQQIVIEKVLITSVAICCTLTCEDKDCTLQLRKKTDDLFVGLHHLSDLYFLPCSCAETWFLLEDQ